MSGPFPGVNIFVSMSRNAFLLSSISLAMFGAGWKHPGLWWMKYYAMAALMLSIWNGLSSCMWFETYLRKTQNENLAQGVVADYNTWDTYRKQVLLYTGLLILILITMVVLALSQHGSN